MMLYIPGLTTAVLLIAILSLSSSLAIGADDYPSRPIKLMVGASPGGTTDTMARAIAPPLASSLGRPVLVENRPGAGGNLAADAVAKSAPDGYTLLVSFTSHTINATLYPKLPFDPVTDFTPISMIATVPSLLVGNPALPAKDLAALIALAKAKPDTLSIAIGGIGSSLHLAGAQADGRRTHPERAVQGNRASADGCARRPSRHEVHQPRDRNGAGACRQAARLRRDQCSAAAIVSRPACDRNAGLRL